MFIKDDEFDNIDFILDNSIKEAENAYNKMIKNYVKQRQIVIFQKIDNILLAYFEIFIIFLKILKVFSLSITIKCPLKNHLLQNQNLDSGKKRTKGASKTTTTKAAAAASVAAAPAEPAPAEPAPAAPVAAPVAPASVAARS